MRNKKLSDHRNQNIKWTETNHANVEKNLLEQPKETLNQMTAKQIIKQKHEPPVAPCETTTK
jgi:hypothetical protein